MQLRSVSSMMGSASGAAAATNSSSTAAAAGAEPGEAASNYVPFPALLSGVQAVFLDEQGRVVPDETLSKLDKVHDKFENMQLAEGSPLQWEYPDDDIKVMSAHYTLPSDLPGRQGGAAEAVISMHVGAPQQVDVRVSDDPAANGVPHSLSAFTVQVHCKRRQNRLNEEARVWARMLTIAGLMSQYVGLGGNHEPDWDSMQLSGVLVIAKREAAQASK
jgi:hypothetical protein